MLSIWLPHWPADRLRRRAAPETDIARPFAFTLTAQGTERLAAVNRAAGLAGLGAGMRLADARARLPELLTSQETPDADAAALARLARWCVQYSPWVTVEDSGGENGGGENGGGQDGQAALLPGGASLRDHGLRFDISGCAHLFGGEEIMARTIHQRFLDFAIDARLAIADSLGAAWALARFGAEEVIVQPPGERAARRALAGRPIAALRLSLGTVTDLDRLGIRAVGDLYKLPRAGLARRFGSQVADRLDQALGRVREPLSPAAETAALWRRLAFAEPIVHGDDVARAARQLCRLLCQDLQKRGLGGRRLECNLYLASGGRRQVRLGLARASRDEAHIYRLLAEQLPALELGFGADAMSLRALESEPLAASQGALHGLAGAAGGGTPAQAFDDPELGLLIDRLGNRLGLQNIARFAPNDSHLPERAVRVIAPMSPPDERMRPWGDTDDIDRPVRLLPCPELVDAVAEVPDGPPVLFRWRGQMHRVVRAEGPERIAPEWWRETTAVGAARQNARTRDYFRVEDIDGRRYWLYRLGLYPAQGGEAEAPPRWYLHGLFA